MQRDDGSADAAGGLGPVAAARTAAGAIAMRDRAVLLVRPTYKDHWEIPGGYVRPGESPAAACRREIREELGVDAGRLTPAAVDWAPQPGEGDKILLVFAAPELSELDPAGFAFPDGELAEARYIALDALSEYTIPRLVRRLTAAADAAAAGRTVYLENGIALL
jgi:8-oxo-dGTP diphosphatase